MQYIFDTFIIKLLLDNYFDTFVSTLTCLTKNLETQKMINNTLIIKLFYCQTKLMLYTCCTIKHKQYQSNKTYLIPSVSVGIEYVDNNVIM